MSLLDHAFVFIIAVVYPILGFISFRRLLRRAAAGEPVNRPHLYRSTYIGHWSMFFVFVAIWMVNGREWSTVGLTSDADLWTIVGGALTVVAIVTLVMQLRFVQKSTQEELERLSKRIGKLSIIIPHTRSELLSFYGIAVTAGVVEEILWRGFLIWYLNQFMPLWAAATISAIGFAAAHAYQGIGNMPQLAAVSVVFTALYLLSGSIWLPIVLHAAVDILQGRLGYDVIRRTNYGDRLPNFHRQPS